MLPRLSTTPTNPSSHAVMQPAQATRRPTKHSKQYEPSSTHLTKSVLEFRLQLLMYSGGTGWYRVWYHIVVVNSQPARVLQHHILTAELGGYLQILAGHIASPDQLPRTSHVSASRSPSVILQNAQDDVVEHFLPDVQRVVLASVPTWYEITSQLPRRIR